MTIVHLVAAARPNFMKVAPLWHALNATADFRPVLIHTGQHYDANMSSAIWDDLDLPPPDHHLGVGSGSHGEQTGAVMIAYERLALDERPDWTVVVGDVNSTVAAALVAAKLRIPLAHLEAGLRSGDRDMPEEINRIVTDAVADLLWTPSEDADANLRREGVAAERISLVGNIMIDSFERSRARIEQAAETAAQGVERGGYGVVTLHRPSNVDHPARLAAVVEALVAAQQRLPLIFPLHPRTAARLADGGLGGRLAEAGVKLIEPLPYIRFMSLATAARLVVTDSGGLQEETSYLGIPCLTLRDNTERPITVSQGTNRLVTAASLPGELERALDAAFEVRRPPLWDGQTARRCVDDLRRLTAGRNRAASRDGEET